MTVRVLVGDCLDVLATLPAESVQCCVTSPPYYALRDYGVAGQIGLEDSPDAYIAKMVSVFREVRRVLRPDATLWLNIGDSYAGSGKGPSNSMQSDAGQVGPSARKKRGLNNLQDTPTQWIPLPSSRGSRIGSQHGESGHTSGVTPPPGLKSKDLIGIPWMLAFALRADGWYLRSDIIWSKPNPMPESVTDRPTKAHEYLFLLSKSARYHYDADAIREPYAPASLDRQQYARDDIRSGVVAEMRVSGEKGLKGGPRRDDVPSNPQGANRRSVWTIPTAPFPQAHFATYPVALVEPCIKAGCPEGGTVLDPFAGAGTTGLAADRLGRDAVLIELNPAYAEMARRRIAQDAPLFADAPIEPKPLPLKDKQAQDGNRQHAGFNARWDAKEATA